MLYHQISHISAKIPVRFRTGLVMLILTLTWGSSFFLVKKALLAFTPEQVVAGRFLFSGLLLLPAALRVYPAIPGEKWRPLLVFALISNLSTSWLFAMAQTRVDSSLNGIINTLTPMMTLLMGVYFFRQRLRKSQIPGLVLGFAAAVWLMVASRGIGGHINWFILFTITATLLNGYGMNVLNSRLQGLSAFQITSSTYFILLPPALTFTLVSGFWQAAFTSPHGLQAVLCLLFLAIFANAIGLILFSKLVQWSGAVSATTTTYLMPIVSIFLGFVDHESITYIQIGAMAVIIFSVWMVNRQPGAPSAN
ncbi:MAG: DMT family transporter [Bacteroidetes bacterium]|nr:MAG: DMT family transporter [Bacteroidota bacterium]